MDTYYPTLNEPATPEYVLAVLQDMHRQQCEYDCMADCGISLSFDSTIAEWREACDLLPWSKLGRAYNKFFGINCSDSEWRTVLHPQRKKNLYGVCKLVAEHTSRPRIRPARLLGGECKSAGAFLTVRSMLASAGADADKIGPSTPLAVYTRKYYKTFLIEVPRLAPGAMPLVKIKTTAAHTIAAFGMLIGLLCVMASGFAASAGLLMIGLVIAAVCYLAALSAASELPTSVEVGDLQTFRDLACVLAESRVWQNPQPPSPT